MALIATGLTTVIIAMHFLKITVTPSAGGGLYQNCLHTSETKTNHGSLLTDRKSQHTVVTNLKPVFSLCDS